MRLIDYLITSGLVENVRTAQGLTMRGDVLVDDRPETSIAFEVTSDMHVRLRQPVNTNVSKGAAKLRPVIERLTVDCAGKICLDLGVSTGGFTQVLLERGAQRVYAVDVGYGVTALEIRNDPRVVLLERTNARLLTDHLIPELIQVVVGDLSFISWEAVLPAVIPLLAAQAELMLLVKPQFELAAQGLAHLLDDGVLYDRTARRECLIGLYNAWVEHGLRPVSVMPAAITGAKGNQEFFVLLHSGEITTDHLAYCALVEAALQEAAQ
jgi:23S rRNA (cytidine1920-2'-O)/16S rRNA (cytidine1409-2'-O)-methyltransferase